MEQPQGPARNPAFLHQAPKPPSARRRYLFTNGRDLAGRADGQEILLALLSIPQIDLRTAI